MSYFLALFGLYYVPLLAGFVVEEPFVEFLSGDLFVNDADLSIVLSDWGKGTPSAYGQSIPEPATLSLLLIGSLLVVVRKKTRSGA